MPVVIIFEKRYPRPDEWRGERSQKEYFGRAVNEYVKVNQRMNPLRFKPKVTLEKDWVLVSAYLE